MTSAARSTGCGTTADQRRPDPAGPGLCGISHRPQLREQPPGVQLTRQAEPVLVVRRICERRGVEPPTPIESEAPFRQFVVEAMGGEPVARAVFDQAGRMLGTAVANLLNDRDPGRIVIAVFDPELPRLLEGGFRAALKADTLGPVYGQADIRFDVIDGDHYRKGCAALALGTSIAVDRRIFELR